MKSKPRKIKLLPQKLGDSVIFSKSGLSAFWTNILPMLSSCTIYLGKLVRYRCHVHVSKTDNLSGIFLALFFGEKIHQFKGSLCGALSGIFLYLSLASLFPVLHSLMSEQVTFDQETKKFHKKTKKQYCLRLILANIAFFIAIGMLVYLVQTGPNLLHLKGVDDFYKTSKEKFTEKTVLILKFRKRSSATSWPNGFLE